MTEFIVEAEGLTRRFGGLTAVAGLDLAIRPGEIFGLLGPDGAGKTTTLRMFCGLLEATEGTRRVCGYDVARELTAVKDRIGYMAQRFGLYQDLTVAENLLFYADLYGLAAGDREPLMTSLLRMTRMNPFQDRGAGKLSGGMKQKLGLMCALLHRPEVLFLDEPTNGVDPVSRRDFWQILYELVKEGLTVFVSTAYMDEAERCHRVGLLHGGRLIRSGTPRALKTSMEEACFSISTPRLRQAREVLGRLPEVLSVEFSGPVLHLFLETGASPQAVRQALDEAGLREAEVVSIDPSLEDVFIGLMEKEARRAA